MLSPGRKVTVARYYLSVPMEFIKIADAPLAELRAGRQIIFSLSSAREEKAKEVRLICVTQTSTWAVSAFTPAIL